MYMRSVCYMQALLRLTSEQQAALRQVCTDHRHRIAAAQIRCQELASKLEEQPLTGVSSCAWTQVCLCAPQLCRYMPFCSSLLVCMCSGQGR